MHEHIANIPKKVELDFCPNCEGLYFDKGEIELLKDGKEAQRAEKQGSASSTAIAILGVLLVIVVAGIFGPPIKSSSFDGQFVVNVLNPPNK